MIIDRRTANPIARLRPIPDTDRFELFYWSNVDVPKTIRHASGHCETDFQRFPIVTPRSRSLRFSQYMQIYGG
jgi:hypothetical protein